MSRRLLPSAAAFAAALAFAYGPVAGRLVRDWLTDDNYSHGLFVVPLALYFAWQRRTQLADAPLRPSPAGLLVVLASLSLLVAGTLGAELFLTRVSLVGVVLGTTLFTAGLSHVRILAFPIAFLLLMIPLPAIVLNEIAFPLQLLASRTGETALQLLGVPVLREGNLIVLANTTLEVAEACSGIRSLVSLLTLAIVLGYFLDSRVWVRIAIAVASVPVAVVTNGMRVAGTGVAAYYAGGDAATGFLHAFSGWILFAVAFGILMLVHRLVVVVVPPPAEPVRVHGS